MAKPQVSRANNGVVAMGAFREESGDLGEGKSLGPTASSFIHSAGRGLLKEGLPQRPGWRWTAREIRGQGEQCLFPQGTFMFFLPAVGTGRPKKHGDSLFPS